MGSYNSTVYLDLRLSKGSADAVLASLGKQAEELGDKIDALKAKWANMTPQQIQDSGRQKEYDKDMKEIKRMLDDQRRLARAMQQDIKGLDLISKALEKNMKLTAQQSDQALREVRKRIKALGDDMSDEAQRELSMWKHIEAELQNRSKSISAGFISVFDEARKVIKTYRESSHKEMNKMAEDTEKHEQRVRDAAAKTMQAKKEASEADRKLNEATAKRQANAEKQQHAEQVIKAKKAQGVKLDKGDTVDSLTKQVAEARKAKQETERQMKAIAKNRGVEQRVADAKQWQDNMNREQRNKKSLEQAGAQPGVRVLPGGPSAQNAETPAEHQVANDKQVISEQDRIKAEWQKLNKQEADWIKDKQKKQLSAIKNDYATATARRDELQNKLPEGYAQQYAQAKADKEKADRLIMAIAETRGTEYIDENGKKVKGRGVAVDAALRGVKSELQKYDTSKVEGEARTEMERKQAENAAEIARLRDIQKRMTSGNDYSLVERLDTDFEKARKAMLERAGELESLKALKESGSGNAALEDRINDVTKEMEDRQKAIEDLTKKITAAGATGEELANGTNPELAILQKARQAVFLRSKSSSSTKEQKKEAQALLEKILARIGQIQSGDLSGEMVDLKATDFLAGGDKMVKRLADIKEGRSNYAEQIRELQGKQAEQNAELVKLKAGEIVVADYEGMTPEQLEAKIAEAKAASDKAKSDFETIKKQRAAKGNKAGQDSIEARIRGLQAQNEVYGRRLSDEGRELTAEEKERKRQLEERQARLEEDQRLLQAEGIDTSKMVSNEDNERIRQRSKDAQAIMEKNALTKKEQHELDTILSQIADLEWALAHEGIQVQESRRARIEQTLKDFRDKKDKFLADHNLTEEQMLAMMGMAPEAPAAATVPAGSPAGNTSSTSTGVALASGTQYEYKTVKPETKTEKRRVKVGTRKVAAAGGESLFGAYKSYEEEIGKIQKLIEDNVAAQEEAMFADPDSLTALTEEQDKLGDKLQQTISDKYNSIAGLKDYDESLQAIKKIDITLDSNKKQIESIESVQPTKRKSEDVQLLSELKNKNKELEAHRKEAEEKMNAAMVELNHVGFQFVDDASKRYKVISDIAGVASGSAKEIEEDVFEEKDVLMYKDANGKWKEAKNGVVPDIKVKVPKSQTTAAPAAPAPQAPIQASSVTVQTSGDANVQAADDVNVGGEKPVSVEFKATPEEVAEALAEIQKDGETYLHGHGTGNTPGGVDPNEFFRTGLRVPHGDVSETTIPLSNEAGKISGKLSNWGHNDSKQVVIIPAKSSGVVFGPDGTRTPLDMFGDGSFQYKEEQVGTGILAHTVSGYSPVYQNGQNAVWTKPEAPLGVYDSERGIFTASNINQYYEPYRGEDGKLHFRARGEQSVPSSSSAPTASVSHLESVLKAVEGTREKGSIDEQVKWQELHVKALQHSKELDKSEEEYTQEQTELLDQYNAKRSAVIVSMSSEGLKGKAKDTMDAAIETMKEFGFGTENIGAGVAKQMQDKVNSLKQKMKDTTDETEKGNIKKEVDRIEAAKKLLNGKIDEQLTPSDKWLKTRAGWIAELLQNSKTEQTDKDREKLTKEQGKLDELRGMVKEVNDITLGGIATDEQIAAVKKMVEDAKAEKAKQAEKPSPAPKKEEKKEEAPAAPAAEAPSAPATVPSESSEGKKEEKPAEKKKRGPKPKDDRSIEQKIIDDVNNGFELDAMKYVAEGEEMTEQSAVALSNSATATREQMLDLQGYTDRLGKAIDATKKALEIAENNIEMKKDADRRIAEAEANQSEASKNLTAAKERLDAAKQEAETSGANRLSNAIKVTFGGAGGVYEYSPSEELAGIERQKSYMEKVAMPMSEQIGANKAALSAVEEVKEQITEITKEDNEVRKSLDKQAKTLENTILLKYAKLREYEQKDQEVQRLQEKIDANEANGRLEEKKKRLAKLKEDSPEYNKLAAEIEEIENAPHESINYTFNAIIAEMRERRDKFEQGSEAYNALQLEIDKFAQGGKNAQLMQLSMRDMLERKKAERDMVMSEQEAKVQKAERGFKQNMYNELINARDFVTDEMNAKITRDVFMPQGVDLNAFAKENGLGSDEKIRLGLQTAKDNYESFRSYYNQLLDEEIDVEGKSDEEIVEIMRNRMELIAAAKEQVDDARKKVEQRFSELHKWNADMFDLWRSENGDSGMRVSPEVAKRAGLDVVATNLANGSMKAYDYSVDKPDKNTPATIVEFLDEKEKVLKANIATGERYSEKGYEALLKKEQEAKEKAAAKREQIAQQSIDMYEEENEKLRNLIESRKKIGIPTDELEWALSLSKEQRAELRGKLMDEKDAEMGFANALESAVIASRGTTNSLMESIKRQRADNEKYDAIKNLQNEILGEEAASAARAGIAEAQSNWVGTNTKIANDFYYYGGQKSTIKRRYSAAPGEEMRSNGSVTVGNAPVRYAEEYIHDNAADKGSQIRAFVDRIKSGVTSDKMPAWARQMTAEMSDNDKRTLIEALDTMTEKAVQYVQSLRTNADFNFEAQQAAAFEALNKEQDRVEAAKAANPKGNYRVRKQFQDAVTDEAIVAKVNHNLEQHLAKLSKDPKKFMEAFGFTEEFIQQLLESGMTTNNILQLKTAMADIISQPAATLVGEGIQGSGMPRQGKAFRVGADGKREQLPVEATETQDQVKLLPAEVLDEQKLDVFLQDLARGIIMEGNNVHFLGQAPEFNPRRHEMTASGDPYVLDAWNQFLRENGFVDYTRDRQHKPGDRTYMGQDYEGDKKTEEEWKQEAIARQQKFNDELFGYFTIFDKETKKEIGRFSRVWGDTGMSDYENWSKDRKDALNKQLRGTGYSIDKIGLKTTSAGKATDEQRHEFYRLSAERKANLQVNKEADNLYLHSADKMENLEDRRERIEAHLNHLLELQQQLVAMPFENPKNSEEAQANMEHLLNTFLRYKEEREAMNALRMARAEDPTQTTAHRSAEKRIKSAESIKNDVDLIMEEDKTIKPDSSGQTKHTKAYLEALGRVNSASGQWKDYLTLRREMEADAKDIQKFEEENKNLNSRNAQSVQRQAVPLFDYLRSLTTYETGEKYASGENKLKKGLIDQRIGSIKDHKDTTGVGKTNVQFGYSAFNTAIANLNTKIQKALNSAELDGNDELKDQLVKRLIDFKTSFQQKVEAIIGDSKGQGGMKDDRKLDAALKGLVSEMNAFETGITEDVELNTKTISTARYAEAKERKRTNEARLKGMEDKLTADKTLVTLNNQKAQENVKNQSEQGGKTIGLASDEQMGAVLREIFDKLMGQIDHIDGMDPEFKKRFEEAVTGYLESIAASDTADAVGAHGQVRNTAANEQKAGAKVDELIRSRREQVLANNPTEETIKWATEIDDKQKQMLATEKEIQRLKDEGERKNHQEILDLEEKRKLQEKELADLEERLKLAQAHKEGRDAKRERGELEQKEQVAAEDAAEKNETLQEVSAAEQDARDEQDEFYRELGDRRVYRADRLKEMYQQMMAEIDSASLTPEQHKAMAQEIATIKQIYNELIGNIAADLERIGSIEGPVLEQMRKHFQEVINDVDAAPESIEAARKALASIATRDAEIATGGNRFSNDEVKDAIRNLQEYVKTAKLTDEERKKFVADIAQGNIYLDEMSKKDTVTQMNEQFKGLRPEATDAYIKKENRVSELDVLMSEQDELIAEGNRKRDELENQWRDALKEREKWVEKDVELTEDKLAAEEMVGKLETDLQDGNIDDATRNHLTGLLEEWKQRLADINQEWANAEKQVDDYTITVSQLDRNIEKQNLSNSATRTSAEQVKAELAAERKELNDAMREMEDQYNSEDHTNVINMSKDALQKQLDFYKEEIRLRNELKAIGEDELAQLHEAAKGTMDYEKRVKLLNEELAHRNNEFTADEALEMASEMKRAKFDFVISRKRSKGPNLDNNSETGSVYYGEHTNDPNKLDRDLGYSLNDLLKIKKALEQARKGFGEILDENGRQNLADINKSLELVEHNITAVETDVMDIDEIVNSKDGLTTTPLNKLKEAAEQLKKQLGEMGMEDEGRNDMIAAYKEINRQISYMNDQLVEHKSQWEQAISRLKTYVMVYMSFNKLMDVGKQVFHNTMELSDQMTNVAKVTNLTEESVEKLTNSLMELNTRTDLSNLMALAEQGGKLGIALSGGEQALVSFVEAGEKIVNTLGEIGGAEAVTELLKVNDLVNKNSEGIEQDLMRVGSSILNIGNNSKASYAKVVDFTRQMGAIGSAARLTMPEIMAIGGTIDALGGDISASATAVSKIVMGLRSNTQQVAQAAHIATDELKAELDNGNTFGALQMVLEGIKRSGQDVSTVLKAMGGRQNVQAKTTMTLLVDNLESLNYQMMLAKEGFEDGTLVTAEYEKANNNLAGTVEQIKNEFREMTSTAEGSNGAMLTVSRIVLDVVRGFRDLGGMALMLIPMIAGVTTSFIANTVAAYRNAAAAKGVSGSFAGLLKALPLLITYLWNTAKAFFSVNGAADKAANAMRELKKTSTGNWITLLVTAVVALGVAIYNLFTKTDKLTKRMQELTDAGEAEIKTLNRLNKAIQDTNRSQTDRNNAIVQFNKQFGGYISKLVTEKSTIEELRKAYDEAAAAINKKIAAEIRSQAVKDAREDQKDKLSSASRTIAEELIGDDETKDDLISDITSSISSYLEDHKDADASEAFDYVIGLYESDKRLKVEDRFRFMNAVYDYAEAEAKMNKTIREYELEASKYDKKQKKAEVASNEDDLALIMRYKSLTEIPDGYLPYERWDVSHQTAYDAMERYLKNENTDKTSENYKLAAKMRDNIVRKGLVDPWGKARGTMESQDDEGLKKIIQWYDGIGDAYKAGESNGDYRTRISKTFTQDEESGLVLPEDADNMSPEALRDWAYARATAARKMLDEWRHKNTSANYKWDNDSHRNKKVDDFEGAIAELDRYYKEQETLFDHQLAMGEISEEEARRRQDNLEKEHLERRAALRKSFSKQATKEEKDDFLKWWDERMKTEHNGAVLYKVEWSKVNNEIKQWDDRSHKENMKRRQEDLDKIEEIMIEFNKRLQKAILESRPYEKFAEDLRSNFDELNLFNSGDLDEVRQRTSTIMTIVRDSFRLGTEGIAKTLEDYHIADLWGLSPEQMELMIARIEQFSDQYQDLIRQQAQKVKKRLENEYRLGGKDDIVTKTATEADILSSINAQYGPGIAGLKSKIDNVKRGHAKMDAEEREERKQAFEQRRAEISNRLNELGKVGRELTPEEVRERDSLIEERNKEFETDMRTVVNAVDGYLEKLIKRLAELEAARLAAIESQLGAYRDRQRIAMSYDEYKQRSVDVHEGRKSRFSRRESAGFGGSFFGITNSDAEGLLATRQKMFLAEKELTDMEAKRAKALSDATAAGADLNKLRQIAQEYDIAEADKLKEINGLRAEQLSIEEEFIVKSMNYFKSYGDIINEFTHNLASAGSKTKQQRNIELAKARYADQTSGGPSKYVVFSGDGSISEKWMTEEERVLDEQQREAYNERIDIINDALNKLGEQLSKGITDIFENAFNAKDLEKDQELRAEEEILEANRKRIEAQVSGEQRVTAEMMSEVERRIQLMSQYFDAVESMQKRITPAGGSAQPQTPSTSASAQEQAPTEGGVTTPTPSPSVTAPSQSSQSGSAYSSFDWSSQPANLGSPAFNDMAKQAVTFDGQSWLGPQKDDTGYSVGNYNTVYDALSSTIDMSRDATDQQIADYQRLFDARTGFDKEAAAVHKSTDKASLSSTKSMSTAMIQAMNMYGAVYSTVMNDNLSATQQTEMIALQATGQTLTGILSATLAEMTAKVAAGTPAAEVKLFGSLPFYAALPAVAAMTGLLGFGMAKATQAIAKGKSEVAQATGVSAGRLTTGMLTYATGRYRDDEDPTFKARRGMLSFSEGYAPGKSYGVEGADGKSYNAKYVGRVSDMGTGRVSGTHFGIFSEVKPETVIDGDTTDIIHRKYPFLENAWLQVARTGTLNMQEMLGLDYNAIGKTIDTLSRSGALSYSGGMRMPTFASGRYPGEGSFDGLDSIDFSGNASSADDIASRERLAAAIEALVSNGVQAHMSRTEASRELGKQARFDRRNKINTGLYGSL